MSTLSMFSNESVQQKKFSSETEAREIQRKIIIDKLCASLGTQYRGLKQYRSL